MTQYRFSNYNINHKDWDARQGGGLLLLLRNDVHAIELDLRPYVKGSLEVQGVLSAAGVKSLSSTCISPLVLSARWNFSIPFAN